MQISELKWEEVVEAEKILKDVCGSQLNWQDMPVECASIFLHRFKRFFTQYILGKHALLGRIQHHVVRYEVQGRGSLHTHCLLWVDPADVSRVSKEIVAAIPAASVDGNLKPPSTPLELELAKTVLAKQQHQCR